MGWWLFGQAVSKSYSFWKILLLFMRRTEIEKPTEPRGRVESEHFGELSSKVLAFSGAEIWLFWYINSRIFHILKTYSNCQKSQFVQIGMVISRLPTRLEPSMEAPRKAQIVLFHLVLLVSLFDFNILTIKLCLQKE